MKIFFIFKRAYTSIFNGFSICLFILFKNKYVTYLFLARQIRLRIYCNQVNRTMWLHSSNEQMAYPSPGFSIQSILLDKQTVPCSCIVDSERSNLTEGSGWPHHGTQRHTTPHHAARARVCECHSPQGSHR